MGGLFSHRPSQNDNDESKLSELQQLQKEVSDCRKEVTELFVGQKFLLVGGEGHGKSSLINTFNHVIRLAEPDVVYEEVAQLGAGTASGSTKTVLLTKYAKENSMLFYNVDLTPSNFPVFMDTLGLNENDQLQSRIVDFIQALAAGKISEGTDLQGILQEVDTNFDDAQLDDDMAAWSIIFVASVVHQPLLNLARAVGAASEKRTKQGIEIRIYCILTHGDRLTESTKHEAQVLESMKDYSEALRIPLSRIMKLSNYTSDDIKQDGRTKPNLRKDLQALSAFRRILSKSGTRYWLHGNARRDK